MIYTIEIREMIMPVFLLIYLSKITPFWNMANISILEANFFTYDSISWKTWFGTEPRAQYYNTYKRIFEYVCTSVYLT